MADPVPSVAVATGSLVVTGTGTNFIAAENDLFIAGGAAVPIASRNSPTQITLKQPWPVASLSGAQAFSVLSLGEYWRSASTINKRFADLLSKWEVVSPFKFDAAGTLAERDNYNNQPRGFVYISVDPLPVRLFIKLANTNSAADWSSGAYLGSGGQVEFQEALEQERQQRTQADAALSARADAIAVSLATGLDDARTDVAAEVRARMALIRAADGPGARIVDTLGRILATVDAAGVHASGYNVGGVSIREALGFAASDIIITDRLGRVARYLGPRPDGQDFSYAEVREADDRATADSAHQRMTLNTLTASLSWTVTAVIVYGQSLGQGWETWPVKTTAPAPGVLMLGQSVRPGGATDNPSPAPLGDSILRPAVATSQRIDTGELLTTQQQAALSPGDLSLGEEPGLVAAQIAKRLQLQAFGLRSDDRNIAVVNTAVGGQTIEKLSKGSSPELFNRNRVMATALRNAVIAQMVDPSADPSVGLGAILYFGNEYNYDAQYGGTTDKEQYKARLRQLRLDLVADVQVDIFGQPDLPAVITYQTSGTWVVDASDMSIGMAQYEISQDPTLGWHLAAPSYPVTDKFGHLDANGCRWLACHVGRALHHVMTLRRGWRPTSPLSVVARGRTVLATFHTPSGTGLQFQPMYYGSSPSMLDNRGFAVLDDGGAVKVVDVQIVAPRVVRLTLVRSILGNANLYYGRASEGGGGNLCDRDPTVFPFSYVYQAGSGDYPQANNDLVGKPYPAWNYCINFKHPITRV